MLDGMRTPALLDRSSGTVIVMSVLPAIDAALVRLGPRGAVSAAEVIDTLLDLRLIVVADEIDRAR